MFTTPRLVLALLALLAGGALQAQGPREFSPRNGFLGRSEGHGTMRLLLGRPRAVHVESYGFDRPDGRFQLDQTIQIQGLRPMRRSWVMTTVGPHQYAATLSDAAGPVAARSEGSRLVLRYRYKGPLFVRQTLDLRPDGRTIDNVGRLTLFGLPVGRLRETIVRAE